MAREGGESHDIMFKERVHARVHGYPWEMCGAGGGSSNLIHLRHPPIGAIGSHHLNQLVTVSGTMVRAGPVKMYEYRKVIPMAYYLSWPYHRCTTPLRSEGLHHLP
jgi:DNA replicative helicase MCM subunit Mcm2 (Cdc46/Mcm family)